MLALLLGDFTACASTQIENFDSDLKQSASYWTHKKLGQKYLEINDAKKAEKEFKKAIYIIENRDGYKWPNLKKEDVEQLNQQANVDAQIFSRYGLIEALDAGGKYQEAVDNVEWLQKNQIVKGKEEQLKNKLRKMKNDLQRKLEQSKANSQ
jgi:hypothetical protein